jgi:hypothetical protein
MLIGCEKIASALLVETHTVTTGAFQGLHIGDTKQITFERIAKLGVFAVKPIPSVNFNITRDNIGGLDRLASTDGIRVTDYGGLAIDIYFEAGNVFKIRKSVPARENTWFHEGQSVSVVQKKLAELLAIHNNLVVFPIVYFQGNGWIELAQKEESLPASLKEHNAWTFELPVEKSGSANFDVYFQNESLSRIEYRRTRIPL